MDIEVNKSWGPRRTWEASLSRYAILFDVCKSNVLRKREEKTCAASISVRV
jgi:hypothetical protein